MIYTLKKIDSEIYPVSIVGFELSLDMLSEKLRFSPNYEEITDALVQKTQFTTQKCQITLLPF